jgi:hypothetical protein
MRNYNKADALANDWLKENGISLKQFNTTSTPLLKAQQTAFNLLKHHMQLLNAAQINTLQVYCNQMHNKAKRQYITKSFAYQVLNIGIKINRQLFKQYKNSVINNTPSVT